MDNILLNVKKSLLEELNTKIEKKKIQEKRNTYIVKIITEIEKKFYDLMNFKIELSELKKYIGSLDKSIIFSDKTNRIYKLLDKIPDNNFSSKDIEAFYIELQRFVKILHELKHDKERYILSKEEQIDKLKEIIGKIDDSGYFILPVDIHYIQRLEYYMKSLKSKYLSDDLINYFYREITIKNNMAIKKYITLKNARIIKQNRNKVKSYKTKPQNKDFSLEEKYQVIYDKAKKISDENRELLENLTDIERDYLDDINSISDIDEIKTCVELMADSESSIRLIISALEEKINKITNDNIEQSFKIIEEYIKLYDVYLDKIQQENIENEKNKKEQKKDEIKLIELQNAIDHIKEVICDDNDDLFSELTDKQIRNLDSFSEIDDEANIDSINKTLSNLDLNFEFLLMYNNFKKLSSHIDEYDEFRQLLDVKENINILNRIIQLFEKYNKIKQSYIEEKRSETNKDENTGKKIPDDNILIYLTDDNGITYLEKQVKSASQFLMEEYSTLLDLISDLKKSDSNSIHLMSDKVVPKSGERYSDYKKRRLSQNNQRLVYMSLSKKILKTDKSVYLVITGGTKTETKNAPVYNMANHLKSRVLEFIKKFESLNMSEEEIMTYLDAQSKIEKQLFTDIKPKNLTGAKQYGK